MFGWLEKLILKNAIKRLLKKLPKLKTKTETLVKEHGESLIDEVFEKVEQVVIDFAEKH